MAAPNPYDAPATLAEANPSLPAWTGPVLRAALAVIALDFARGAAWRLATTLATVNRGSFLDGTDHFNPNVVIQLGFAVAAVFAIAGLTRRREGVVVTAPVLRVACIATAIAAVSMYVTRLVVDAVGGVTAGAHLGLATLALDSGAVVLASLYLAALIGDLGAVESRRRVRTLAAIYAVATCAALVVVANNARRHGFLPHGVDGAFLPYGADSAIRTLATLVFITLSIMAYVFVQRLARRTVGSA